MAKPDNNSQMTDVLIGGKVYHLSGGDPEYLQRVASLLNYKLVEVKNIPGYKNLDEDYRILLMNLNLADEYFKAADEAERCRKEAEAKENELYTARHDLVSMKLKLENALKQQDVLEKRVEEWKNRCDELRGFQSSDDSIVQ